MQTVDIISDIVDLVTAEFVITTITDNGGGSYTLTSTNTWWIIVGDIITINGNSYTVASFVLNTSITITGTVLPAVYTFTMNLPVYLNGTLKMAQNEVHAEPTKEDLMPFIYLYEPITDRKNTDEESAIDRESNLRIFFLNSADTSNWLTEDHYLYVIDPMQSLVDLFMDKINNSKFFTDEMTYDNIPLINFSEEGNQALSIFDVNLSGIELRLDAQIREDLSCD